MVPHAAQVVQPHIGGDLKLKNSAALRKFFDQRLSLAAAQVRRVQTVPDPDYRHLLPRSQRFFYASEAVGDIVAQPVILAGMDPDHKSGICLRDPHDLVDYRCDIPYIVEFLSDDIASAT